MKRNDHIGLLSGVFFLAIGIGVGVAGAQSGGPYKIAAADLTGDGIVDLVLAYNAVGLVNVQQGDGQGAFRSLPPNQFTDLPFPCGAENLSLADVDGDGLKDLAVGISSHPQNWHDSELTDEQLASLWKGHFVIARNAGAGQFQPMATFTVPSQAKGVCLADMDNDGRVDLLYTARGSAYRGDMKRGRLYVRQGQGEFKFGLALECPAGPSAYYVETADINNDGYLDILIPNEHGSTVHYVISPGRTIFSPGTKIHAQPLRTTPIPGYRSHAVNDVRAADFNNDGNIDLVTANLGTNCVSIFLGNGDGTFQTDKLLEAGEFAAFLATGDLDNDGDVDFVITHWTQHDVTSVFLNRGGANFFPRKEYQTGLGNYGVALADVDSDGNLDVVTANYKARSYSVLKGRGDGTFENAVTTPIGLRRHEGRWVE